MLLQSLTTSNCPCQLGASFCTEGLGHKCMHKSRRRLAPNLSMEVLWADEWLPLSAEAEIQIGGSTQEVPLA